MLFAVVQCSACLNGSIPLYPQNIIMSNRKGMELGPLLLLLVKELVQMVR